MTDLHWSLVGLALLWLAMVLLVLVFFRGAAELSDRPRPLPNDDDDDARQEALLDAMPLTRDRDEQASLAMARPTRREAVAQGRAMAAAMDNELEDHP